MFETSFSPVTAESAETLLSAYPAFGSGDCNLTAVSLISRAAARKASFAVIEGIPSCAGIRREKKRPMPFLPAQKK